MNDVYLKLASSQMGKSIIEALNLPKPSALIRTPDEPLSQPSGRVLIAAGKNNFAYSHIIKALEIETVKLHTPQFANKPGSLFAQYAGGKNAPYINKVNLENLGVQRFKSIVFDASGLKTPDELKAIYLFFNPVIRNLKSNGKIVIVGHTPQKTDSPEQAAAQSALIGFTKSVAKEIGKKGATCNLIQLDKGSERKIKAALYYLLSPKSSFVTGQSLALTKPRSSARKIDWQAPLTGKTAIVTGAAQGIGEETARVLARDGATVICLDIPANQGLLKKLASDIDGHSLAIDLGASDAAEQIMNTIGSQLGVIDIIVHNAGITRDKTLAKMPEHFWNQVIDINLQKITQINQLLLDKKAFNTRARIVCISSISGIAGNFGQTNYACSKAGIVGYVKALSQIAENGLTINAVAPGFIETKMTQQIPFVTREVGRRTNSLSQGGLPLDVAEAVSFFCHPASQALNGNVLRVCGQNLLGA